MSSAQLPVSGVGYALSRFRKYYEDADFDIPAIEQREFGIGNRKKIDSRHLNFASTAEFRSYLVSNTPMFVSFSTAYYRFPGATPMPKKIWEGADLVFDLDIHAEGKYGAYAHLERVKSDTLRLVELLSSDFGISKKDVFINFSGNRGYHVHVRDREYQELGSDERKEIVDYIMGIGLDYRAFFETEEIAVGVRSVVSKIKSGPSPGESGYRGRFARTVVSAQPAERKSMHRSFGKDDVWSGFVNGIKAGNWNLHPCKSPQDLISRLEPMARDLPVSSVNTDAGVTQDLSKLIRVPGSIHGDTGMVAIPVRDMDGFLPFTHAILKPTGTLKVRFIEDAPELPLLGEMVGPFKAGEEKELPDSAAMFHVLKGSAEIKE